MRTGAILNRYVSRRSAAYRLVYKSNPGRKEETGGRGAASDISPPPKRSSRSLQPPESRRLINPKAAASLLTFASFRRVPVWLINLVQRDFEQWELPKYSTLVEL